MLRKLVVPEFGEELRHIRILEWHKAAGGAIASGDLIVELETSKSVIEVRAARPCVLRKVLCAEGEWAKAGEAFALLTDAADEPMPETAGDAAELAVEFDIV